MFEPQSISFWMFVCDKSDRLAFLINAGFSSSHDFIFNHARLPSKQNPPLVEKFGQLAWTHQPTPVRQSVWSSSHHTQCSLLLLQQMILTATNHIIVLRLVHVTPGTTHMSTVGRYSDISTTQWMRLYRRGFRNLSNLLVDRVLSSLSPLGHNNHTREVTK